MLPGFDLSLVVTEFTGANAIRYGLDRRCYVLRNALQTFAPTSLGSLTLAGRHLNQVENHVRFAVLRSLAVLGEEF